MSAEMACSDTDPRMGRDGRWRWLDDAGNQFPCQRPAVKRLTRAAFENVLGEMVPSYTLQYCAEHWSEAWESEPGITVETVGQAVLL